MKNLHIGDSAKELLKNIYELTGDSPHNVVSNCLLSDLAASIGSKKEFVCKCLYYLNEKGLIAEPPVCGMNDGKETPNIIQITAEGIDLAEKMI